MSPNLSWGSFMRLSYVIVMVSDMKRSVAFYRDVVGLPLRFESPGWSEFATDGATLALHAEGGSMSAATPRGAIPSRCRPGLTVPNLDQFHSRMVELGVACLQAPKDVFGARIAQYADPDGLPFSVSEAYAGNQ
jgi:lactoylglutathione lyase